MYFMATRLQVGDFVGKVLFITMIAYLTLPHLYYYLNSKAEEEYEN